MTQVYARLCALLKAAGYDAWAADAVPQDAALPFVTMEVRPAASLHGVGRVTLTGWMRSPARHADRLALADALLKLVPPAGLKLPLEDGLAILYRGDRMNIEWPENAQALGVCVKHEIRLMGGMRDA